MLKLFLGFLQDLQVFLRIFLNCFSDPDIWLPGFGGRPYSRAGRPVGRPTCTGLCTFGQATGPVDWAVDRTESFALCKSAVDRAVDRVPPTVLFMTVGGRPGGRPPAVLADRNSQRLVLFLGLYKLHSFGFLKKISRAKIPEFL